MTIQGNIMMPNSESNANNGINIDEAAPKPGERIRKEPPAWIKRSTQFAENHSFSVAVACSILSLLAAFSLGLMFRRSELRDERIIRTARIASDLARDMRINAAQDDACGNFMYKLWAQDHEGASGLVGTLIASGIDRSDVATWGKYRDILAPAFRDDDIRQSAINCAFPKGPKPTSINLATPDQYFGFLNSFSRELSTIWSLYDIAFTPWRLGAVDRSAACEIWNDWWDPTLKVQDMPYIRKSFYIIQTLSEKSPRIYSPSGALIYFPTLRWVTLYAPVQCKP